LEKFKTLALTIDSNGKLLFSIKSIGLVNSISGTQTEPFSVLLKIKES
jgi:hypothetical protein